MTNPTEKNLRKSKIYRKKIKVFAFQHNELTISINKLKCGQCLVKEITLIKIWQLNFSNSEFLTINKVINHFSAHPGFY